MSPCEPLLVGCPRSFGHQASPADIGAMGFMGSIGFFGFIGSVSRPPALFRQNKPAQGGSVDVKNGGEKPLTDRRRSGFGYLKGPSGTEARKGSSGSEGDGAYK